MLVRTMRPLRRILREQQLKIEKLQKEKNKERRQEETMAAELASKLKNGLIAHLKQDVDIEVQRKLTPKKLLKYEKSKAALRHKLKVFSEALTSAGGVYVCVYTYRYERSSTRTHITYASTYVSTYL